MHTVPPRCLNAHVCRSSPNRQFNPLLMGTVEALFKFPLFFDAATKHVSCGLILDCIQ